MSQSTLQKNNIDYLFNFFGYGEPEARLWFIGIEEGGEPTPPKTKTHSYHPIGIYYSAAPGPCKKRHLWNRYNRISQATNKGEYFMSNISPIARININAKIKGVTDVRAYRTRVKEHRIIKLAEMIKFFKPEVVFFHGKAGWRDHGMHRKLGHNPSGQYEVREEEETIFIYSDFLGRLSIANENKIIEEIRTTS